MDKPEYEVAIFDMIFATAGSLKARRVGNVRE